ncbi:MAG TPA: YidB family protein [Methylomirabilota bacterium]|nr:YidB family protein [Methylomirabilota bacterium]
MGLLDELLGGVLGGVAGQQRNRPPESSAAAGGGAAQIMMALLPVVLSMLANRGGGPRAGGGGLGGLLEQMQKAGFGEQAKSWVGTGQNMPISPDAMSEIFGKDGVEEIARRTDLTPQEASEGLSQLLPEVVDRVTPGGHEPDFDELIRSVEHLRTRMGA